MGTCVGMGDTVRPRGSPDGAFVARIPGAGAGLVSSMFPRIWFPIGASTIRQSRTPAGIPRPQPSPGIVAAALGPRGANYRFFRGAYRDAADRGERRLRRLVYDWCAGWPDLLKMRRQSQSPSCFGSDSRRPAGCAQVGMSPTSPRSPKRCFYDWVELRCFASTVGLVYSVIPQLMAVHEHRPRRQERCAHEFFIAFRSPLTRHDDSPTVHLLAVDAQNSDRQ